MADPALFKVQGTLKVRMSATVLCLRRQNPVKVQNLTLDNILPPDSGLSPKEISASRDYFSKLETFEQEEGMRFDSGWEILMGQNEVLNLLRSEKGNWKTMRFGGEFKLPGGNQDEGESLEQCAKREFYEEFLRFSPDFALPEEELKQKIDSIVLRPFSVFQTRPVRSRSNLMHNFVCLAEENPFLENFDLNAVNSNLADKEAQALDMVADGSYWNLTPEEKELISPEVHKIEWMSLHDAVSASLTSFVPKVFVNNFQRDHFARFRRKGARRDPMFITGMTILEVEALVDSKALINYCENKVGTFEEMRKKEQWIFDGAPAEEVNAMLLKRVKGMSKRRGFLTPELMKQAKVVGDPRFFRAESSIPLSSL